MVKRKKGKEMNPKQRRPGKCASPSATTISFSVNKASCTACWNFMPQLVNGQTA